VQEIEIALAPMGGRKTQPGYQAEQQHEDDERGPIHVLHSVSPKILSYSF
jgi:hypothetical protein